MDKNITRESEKQKKYAVSGTNKVSEVNGFF
jgi:hypothetical protein